MKTVRSTMQARLTALKQQNLYRQPPLIEKREGKFVQVAGKQLLNFASNDYLGLAESLAWQKEIASIVSAHSPGTASSRLVTGHLAEIDHIEQRLADFFGYDECLLLPSGYQANLAVLWGLLTNESVVCFDKRIHASMAHALPQTGATLSGYAHSNLEQLDRKLDRLTSDTQPIVLTESLFSMDGDVLDVEAFQTVSAKHNAFTIVDEAHSFGVLGHGGRGIAKPAADIAVGTLGKAYGLSGAFVLMPAGFKEFLCNTASPVMYSTAISPSHAACALAAITRAEGMDAERKQLATTSQILRDGLQNEGFTVLGDAHVIAVEIGNEEKAVQLTQAMREDGILVFAARYPTVPQNKAVIRIGITALHDAHDAGYCIASLTKQAHYL